MSDEKQDAPKAASHSAADAQSELAKAIAVIKAAADRVEMPVEARVRAMAHDARAGATMILTEGGEMWERYLDPRHFGGGMRWLWRRIALPHEEPQITPK